MVVTRLSTKSITQAPVNKSIVKKLTKKKSVNIISDPPKQIIIKTNLNDVTNNNGKTKDSQKIFKNAIQHLIQVDPRLEQVVKNNDVFHIFTQPSEEPCCAFKALVKSIIYQQLSGKAASCILHRFVLLYPSSILNSFPEPIHILNTSIELLKSVGLSLRKVMKILSN